MIDVQIDSGEARTALAKMERQTTARSRPPAAHASAVLLELLRAGVPHKTGALAAVSSFRDGTAISSDSPRSPRSRRRPRRSVRAAGATLRIPLPGAGHKPAPTDQDAFPCAPFRSAAGERSWQRSMTARAARSMCFRRRVVLKPRGFIDRALRAREDGLGNASSPQERSPRRSARGVE